MHCITPHTRLTLAAAAAALACVLAGCATTTGHAQAQGKAAAQAATTPDSLAETTWHLERWTAPDGTQRPLAAHAGEAPTLAFAATNREYRVSGYSGCNTFEGGYRLQDGRLSITVPAATRMNCAADEQASIERAFLQGLGQIATFTLDSGGAPRKMTLNLRDGDVMDFTRGDDLPTRL